MGALGRAQQSEVGDNNEVDDVLVEDAIFGVLQVEDVQEGSQDGDVDRAGSCLRVIFSSHGVEEISE